MMNRNSVNAAYNGNSLYSNNGMANALLMLSSIQFSILRLASNHIPAHAVALTHASATGTVESVKFISTVYSNTNAITTMEIVMIQSLLVLLLIAGAV